MKSNIHRAVEDITKAVAPILFKIQDYDVIFPAMCMVMARVIQSTPDRGEEMDVLEDSYNEIKHALNQFLQIEREKEATKAKLDKGISGFNGFAQPTIEPGSAGDYPDNPNQNVAKTVAPFRDQAGNLTQEGFDQLKQDVVNLHTPDEYTPGEGAYSQDPEPPEASQEASGQ
jgi:hypothetical protein